MVYIHVHTLRYVLAILQYTGMAQVSRGYLGLSRGRKCTVMENVRRGCTVPTQYERERMVIELFASSILYSTLSEWEEPYTALRLAKNNVRTLYPMA